MIKNISTVVSSVAPKLLVGSLIALAPFAAFAQTSVNTSVSAASSVNSGTIMKIPPVGLASSTRTAAGGSGGVNSGNATRVKGDTEITARVSSLNQLSANIQAMKNVSASDKVTIESTISSEISNLTTLKNKIDASTETAADLVTDVESITKDYRVYLLVLPQERITASVDAAFSVTTSMQELSVILQTRITQAQSAGHDMTAAQAALNDLNAKVADAKTQASAALAEVANLVPDQGDATVQASNTAALKDANAKLNIVSNDFTAARADISLIEKAVNGLGSTTGGSVTATTSTAAGV
jgi:chromosome segregation ATPase